MDPEVDWCETGNHPNALARTGAAGERAVGTRPIASCDVDQEDVVPELVAVPAVSPGAARCGPLRAHRVDGHGVLRIHVALVHRVGFPANHALLHTRLGGAERRLHAALILAHPLLLGAGEERSGDQRPDNDQGEDRNRERHTALVPQNPFHALSFIGSDGPTTAGYCVKQRSLPRYPRSSARALFPRAALRWRSAHAP